jgi:S-adenosylmethionine synthetase
MKTAEYVRKGHPDRVCEIIADSLLDEFIKQDPNSRVAIEVFGCHGIIIVGGEVTTNAHVDISKIVKDTYKEIGYIDTVDVHMNISEQSREISDLADIGAGDSGIMIGYATNETKEMLPLEVVLAKNICNALDKKGDILLPDGKVQVTLQNDIATNVVVSYQSIDDYDDLVKTLVIQEIGSHYNSVDTKIKIIRFVEGGFNADTGLTGRKNVLWYGPSIPTGGGAFAGKDPTKVDRTGAYLARMIAVREVEKNRKQQSLVEIAYMIGSSTPLYIKIDGEMMDNSKICKLKLKDIIKILKLDKPIYKDISLNGHFGSTKFVWK